MTLQVYLVSVTNDNLFLPQQFLTFVFDYRIEENKYDNYAEIIKIFTCVVSQSQYFFAKLLIHFCLATQYISMSTMCSSENDCPPQNITGVCHSQTDHLG